jgi:hypothetical protein
MYVHYLFQVGCFTFLHCVCRQRGIGLVARNPPIHQTQGKGLNYCLGFLQIQQRLMDPHGKLCHMPRQEVDEEEDEEGL